jgi:hypothetical protein
VPDVSEDRSTFIFRVKRHIPADLDIQPHLCENPKPKNHHHPLLTEALQNACRQNSRIDENADHLLKTALIAIFWRTAMPPLDRHAGIHRRRAVGRNGTALDAAASANTRRPYNRFAQKEAGSHYMIGLILL